MDRNHDDQAAPPVDIAAAEALRHQAEVAREMAKQTKDLPVVNAAIQLQHRVLMTTVVRGHPAATAEAWFDLAHLYGLRHMVTHRAADLDRAIDVARQAAAQSLGTHQQSRAHELLSIVLEHRGTGSRLRHPFRSRTDLREAAAAHQVAH